MNEAADHRTENVWRRPLAATAAAIVAAAGIAACATTPPPTGQVAVAKAAIADAVSAGGEQLAPEPLHTAQKKLALADTAMAARNYADARRLAEAAEVDARLAAVTARSTKAQLAAAELERGIRALKEELARAPR
jgi:Domain of unknown function (DUF4398)